MANPTWSDKVSVVAVQKVANGSTARGTLNLGSVFGAYIFARVGRLSTTAPTTGIYIRVRRYVFDSGNSRDIPHPTPLLTLQDTKTAANSTTISSLSAGPPGSFTLAATTGFGAAQTVCLVDSTTTPTRAEWHMTSKLSGSVLTLDRGYANISSGDTISNQAMVAAPVWVDGGAGNTNIEVIFDYGGEASSSPVVVEAWAQTLNTIG
jgi:hypothetical protein